ncbi:hypothetical protein C2845_PM03G24860 [Panicum miliaceum]|uniref:Uncharacterized protein n=1 Tax=Panicum miliaceum TaxID=4540 RepID=A0A3L6TA07_PANMI|nr:hypothetical protein C2845_PM03G24860 [Panicum miliaceum]
MGEYSLTLISCATPLSTSKVGLFPTNGSSACGPSLFIPSRSSNHYCHAICYDDEEHITKARLFQPWFHGTGSRGHGHPFCSGHARYDI